MSKKSTYETAEFKCPFFEKDEPYAITCEGVTDASRISVRFTRRADRNRQAEIFCKNKYENCEIYRMLMMKYE